MAWAWEFGMKGQNFATFQKQITLVGAVAARGEWEDIRYRDKRRRRRRRRRSTSDSSTCAVLRSMRAMATPSEVSGWRVEAFSVVSFHLGKKSWKLPNIWRKGPIKSVPSPSKVFPVLSPLSLIPYLCQGHENSSSILE